MGNKTSDRQIPVLHIFHNQDAVIYKAKIREDKAYMHGEKIAEFSSKAVFTIINTLGKPKKFKCIIYLDGKSNACQIMKGINMKKKILEDLLPIEKEMLLAPTSTINIEKLQEIPDQVETLFEPLTFKDRITIVKREIAKQLGHFKPMETWQFIVIIAMLGTILAVQFIF